MRPPDAERGPGQGPVQDEHATKRLSTPHDTPQGCPWEWRITWRRSAWKATTMQSRRFAREADAAAFVAKLQGEGRPDLSPLASITVHRRPVGAWVVVEEVAA